MGLPALRHDPVVQASRRPRLSVVKTPARPTAPASRPARGSAARSAFVTFSVLIAIAALLGVGRVWLSVRAAEASIDSGRLRNEIKSLRYEGDMLEIQQSSLCSPSRIQAIAGGAMGMQPAGKLTYLDIRPKLADSSKTAAAQPTRDRRGLSGAVAAVMDMAAGEAQVLLVGDVGLATAK